RKAIEALRNWRRSASRKPLLLQGARQVGKTYLLKTFAREFPDSHYFNFEEDPELHRIFEGSLSPEKILTDLSFKSEKKINRGQDLIVLDEIQRWPRAMTSLKYFCEQAPDQPIC